MCEHVFRLTSPLPPDPIVYMHALLLSSLCQSHLYMYIIKTYILTWGPQAVDIHHDMGAPWATSRGGPLLSGWAALGANEPVVPLGPMSRWMSGVLSMRVYIVYVFLDTNVYRALISNSSPCHHLRALLTTSHF